MIASAKKPHEYAVQYVDLVEQGADMAKAVSLFAAGTISKPTMSRYVDRLRDKKHAIAERAGVFLTREKARVTIHGQTGQKITINGAAFLKLAEELAAAMVG
jgi:hypothetical protein